MKYDRDSILVTFHDRYSDKMGYYQIRFGGKTEWGGQILIWDNHSEIFVNVDGTPFTEMAVYDEAPVDKRAIRNAHTTMHPNLQHAMARLNLNARDYDETLHDYLRR